LKRKIFLVVISLAWIGVSVRAQTTSTLPSAPMPQGQPPEAQTTTLAPTAAQSTVSAPTTTQPAAPQAQAQPQVQQSPPSQGTASTATQTQAPPQSPTQLPANGPQQRLTVQDAEALAMKNNPQISVYRLLSLASNQVTREQRAAYYPNIYGSLTAVEPKENSRIAAGNLNNPIVYERAAGGLTLSQLITDFGRTNNLVASAALRAKAANLNAMATADQIKLAVDEAFYNALQTLAEQTVAEQTVNARQLVTDQITALFQNKLRSQLDVSFATSNLAQARLLLLDAQNNYQSALSSLSQILGYSTQQEFQLVDAETELKPPPDAVTQLVDEAFSNRPEIGSQSYEYQAAQHVQKAERDLLLPSIEALGVVGRTPYSGTVAGTVPFTSWYGAVGLNVNIPIFNGFLYPARSREAGLRAQADAEQLRDLKDRIANDVRRSWLNAITAYNRIGVTQQFVDQTNLAVDLSQTRYNLGLSSIVELSQAQLQQTEAQIQFAAAKYQYRIAESVLRFQVAAP
jgi:outer membrane protein